MGSILENRFFDGGAALARTNGDGVLDYSPSMPWPLRIAFALVIFTIPFETVDTPFTSELFSPAKAAGWLFFLMAVLYPKHAFRRGSYIIWMFALYLAIYFFYGFYQDTALRGPINDRVSTVLQMIIFMWIASNLLVDPVTSRIILLTLGVSTALLSLLQALGITSTPTDIGAASRTTALAEDPNSASAVAALGFLALFGLAYFSDFKSKALKLAAVPMLALNLLTMLKTESRTGMLALVVGLVFFLVNRKGKYAMVKNVLVVGGAAFVVTMVTLSDTMMVSRFQRSFLEGNLAQREKILPAAIEMVKEKPLMGWGPFTNTNELGSRLNLRSRDTHNLLLLVLTEVGLIGSIPYFIGWAGCARNAWKARTKLKNVIPLVLLACLFIVNMGLTWHNRKLHWYVLAYCIASYPYKSLFQRYAGVSAANIGAVVD